MANRIYNATWGRFFSAIYDRGFKATEEAGLREMRRQLLADAGGRVVEIGAGTGANLELFPASVESLTLVEPDPFMTKQLREKLAASDRTAEVVEAPAEHLPFEDASFDTAVTALVLCTVADPEAAVAELERVLKPGGRLLFIEHVRAQDDSLARWQDRLEKPWQFLADGCHCNRDTVATLSASRFTVDQVEHDELQKLPPLVQPLVRGSATLAAS